MPTLDRITIYPIKSLDGVDVAEARVLPSGSLENDRRWRLIDMEGRVVNAKRTPVFHAIRAEFALDERLVSLSIDPAAIAAAAIPGIDRLQKLGHDSFHLVPGEKGPCGWLSEALGCGELLLEERAEGGFPDDRDAPGPTLIATASLVEVARWFRFDLAEARRRFRVNLEIGGCDPFWEDTQASPSRGGTHGVQEGSQTLPTPRSADDRASLAADPYANLPPAQPRAFAIGEARFRAVNACRRCVVPSRDSHTGAATIHFRDAFEARRASGMRPDTDTRAWSHLYRLAINTRAVLSGSSQEAERSLASGQPLRLKSV